MRRARKSSPAAAPIEEIQARGSRALAGARRGTGLSNALVDQVTCHSDWPSIPNRLAVRRFFAEKLKSLRMAHNLTSLHVVIREYDRTDR